MAATTAIVMLLVFVSQIPKVLW